ncbi:MAG: DUF6492 family protein [Geitlerinemataceae cyanobacterium]
MADFDIVIPLFKSRWNTRSTLEGLSQCYSPRSIHIITPGTEVRGLRAQAATWKTAPLTVHSEDEFFAASEAGLSKDAICAELDLGESLYNPGWFYQQLLKVGAFEGIADLSEWYVVWDSDLLPIDTWPLVVETESGLDRPFALLQHNAYGNPAIVSKWENWITTVLGVPAIKDEVGTFIPHHMWMKQSHLKAMAKQVQSYFKSDEHWLKLMMRSANEFGTFGEYWIYSSWVAATAPEDLKFHPYDPYGETTERFFDDGTGLFSAKLREHLGLPSDTDVPFSPSYVEVSEFIPTAYGDDPLPSSIAFESSPRHLKKNVANVHIEESRSRWNPRADLQKA